jgi:hypothetical protein
MTTLERALTDLRTGQELICTHKTLRSVRNRVFLYGLNSGRKYKMAVWDGVGHIKRVEAPPAPRVP